MSSPRPHVPAKIPRSRAFVKRIGSFVLMTFVSVGCLNCGSADQVDGFAGRPPEAVASSRSCPEFGWWLLLPKSMPVGETTDIMVNVTDADTPADKISLEWFAASGSFSERHLRETRYTCEREGLQVLRLVARDDTDCWRMLDIDIACFQP